MSVNLRALWLGLVLAGLAVACAAQPPIDEMQLRSAVANKDIDAFRSLIVSKEGANTNLGGEPLVYQVTTRRLTEFLAHVLAFGADPDARMGAQKMPVLSVAISQRFPAGVKLLLEHGANTNVPYGTLEILPLDIALNQGDFLSAQRLVAHDVDIDRRSARLGRTALHRAVLRRKETTVQFLLQAGASPDVPDKQGKTPRDYAQTRGLIGYFDGGNERLGSKLTM